MLHARLLPRRRRRSKPRCRRQRAVRTASRRVVAKRQSSMVIATVPSRPDASSLCLESARVASATAWSTRSRSHWMLGSWRVASCVTFLRAVDQTLEPVNLCILLVLFRTGNGQVRFQRISCRIIHRNKCDAARGVSQTASPRRKQPIRSPSTYSRAPRPKWRAGTTARSRFESRRRRRQCGESRFDRVRRGRLGIEREGADRVRANRPP